MASPYDQAWPSSYADQKNYADFLLSRAKILYARRTPITLNKFTEPTQAEWENAFVTETGMPLPIPTGVRLYWRSLLNGNIIQYGTLNDAVNGTASTGKVYKMLDANYTQPSFRFIGYLDNQKQVFFNQVYNTGTALIPALSYLPSGSFIYGINNSRLYEWMNLGLDSLMMIVRVRTGDLLAAPPSTLRALWNRLSGSSSSNLWSMDGGGTDALESMYLKMLGNVTVMATLGTPTASAVATEAAIAGSLVGSDSVAGAFSYCQLWVHNISQQVDISVNPDVPRENYHNPAGYARTTWLGASVTDANSAINWGMFAKEDQGIAAHDFLDMSLAIPATGFGTAVHSAKVWVYGIFKNLTGEINV